MTGLLRLIALLPLWLIHAVGGAMGWVVFHLSGRYAERMQENLRLSRVFSDERNYKKLLKQVILETGKGILELLVVWLRPHDKVLDLVRECQGWSLVEAAQEKGKGIIVLTPHLGCYEIAGQYFASKLPITVLYRPPRQKWLESLVVSGRERGMLKAVPADLKGVKALLGALRRGEAIGILPDQVPSRGDGAWVNFFGRPAYTMTLVGQLQKATGATVLLSFSERLSKGKGYILRFESLPEAFPADKVEAAVALNAAVENMIKACPSQYLWSYNRYKVPKGVEAPPV
ncbi:lysophospholipid acyltransferase family protein [Sulfurirhabdus autotrophica]|uniref:KDO2-lipid IV(A) lauroyltransferase n=1 Tax=Sulfurirhabdus autotrophica TaxID=1706046 RepID=A0A4R3Y4T6_9PROT|nr:lysophospholipid acyltransferase family protein [Sulfurirhabdus autotrophica]TCV85133.1 KDO2-lipid IV(A) lauroyltransferase [Sulfurirhabdus autotrophica]